MDGWMDEIGKGVWMPVLRIQAHNRGNFGKITLRYYFNFCQGISMAARLFVVCCTVQHGHPIVFYALFRVSQ
jgi:hypothetical protein